jgi:hypothetical protein
MGEEPVADERVERAAVAGHLAHHPGGVGVEEVDHLLGAELLRERGEVADVEEHDFTGIGA